LVYLYVGVAVKVGGAAGPMVVDVQKHPGWFILFWLWLSDWKLQRGLWLLMFKNT
jgi:hypothetical protein